jgi:hypothetical protein
MTMTLITFSGLGFVTGYSQVRREILIALCLDTGILTKNVDANHGSSATTYASYLISEIQVQLSWFRTVRSSY